LPTSPDVLVIYEKGARYCGVVTPVIETGRLIHEMVAEEEE
jgi:hypothetical protein